MRVILTGRQRVKVGFVASRTSLRTVAGATYEPRSASRSRSARSMSSGAAAWWPSTVTRTSVVSSRAALARDWRQHQRRALTCSSSSLKMTSPGSGCSVALEPRSAHRSPPWARRTVVPPPTPALVEDGHRQGVADAHEVGQVDERVDRGELALLGQAAQQGLGGGAVLGGVHAETAEDAAPGGQGGQLGERGLADALADRGLLSRRRQR